MVTTTIWIADLRISQATAKKIAQKHRITGREVKEALVCVSGLRFAWDDDSERGLRALVEVEIRRPVIVVLYPRPTDAYGDSWALGSVYPR